MSKRRHILVAGFDFGTRFSKVVLRDQNTQVTKVVTFPSKSPALYPSCICLRDGRMLPPEQRTEDGQMLHYLKMIAGHSWAGKDIRTGGFSVPKEFEELALRLGASEAATIVVSYYFARVIAGIRTFIGSDEDWSDFDFSQSQHQDAWAVQVCVPAGLMEWDPDVEERFQDALFLGWEFHSQLLANDKSGTSIEVWASQCLHRLKTGFSDAERNALKKVCVTYPEVAAGVQSILRSRNARDGRYITMDVGAGTIDLNIFFRASGQELGRRENAKNLDYYSAKVEPLGADHIQEDIGRIHAETFSYPQGLSPRSRTSVMHDVGRAVDQLFKSALAYQPNLGVGAGRRTWDRNTFVYLWGGGSKAEGYREALERSLNHSGILEPEVRQLENPAELEIPASADFGRLAVAYGLSHYIANLEAVKLPGQLSKFCELYPELATEIRVAGFATVGQTCQCAGLNPSCAKCYGKGYIEETTTRLENPTPTPGIQPQNHERTAKETTKIIHNYSGPQASIEDRRNLKRMTLSYVAAGDRIPFETVCRDYLKILQIGDSLQSHGVRKMPDEYDGALRVFSNESKRIWQVGVTADWTSPSRGRVDYICHRLNGPLGSPLRRIKIQTNHKLLRSILEPLPYGTVLLMKGCLVFKKPLSPKGKYPAKPAAILFHILNPEQFIVAS